MEEPVPEAGVASDATPEPEVLEAREGSDVADALILLAIGAVLVGIIAALFWLLPWVLDLVLHAEPSGVDD